MCLVITGMMTFNCNVGPALLAPGDTDRDTDNGVQTAGSIGKDALLFTLFARVSISLYMYMTFPTRSWRWKNSHSL